MAEDIYKRAKVLPSTATLRIVADKEGVLITDDTFAPATRAQLIWAFKKDNMVPYVLKVSSIFVH